MSLRCQVILYQLIMEWFISYLYGTHTVYIRDDVSLNNEDKLYRKQLGSMITNIRIVALPSPLIVSSSRALPCVCYYAVCVSRLYVCLCKIYI